MQRSDRWPDDYDPDFPSRPTSRRNSASSRRNSLKKEEKPLSRSPHTSSSSSHSTPKKVLKGRPDQQFDFVVTGKPLLKKSDRANSMPGCYHRRPTDISTKPKSIRSAEVRRLSHVRDDTRDQVEDMSLDLSQISDFEDVNSKYGRHQRPPLASSTPKPKLNPKARSASGNIQNVNKVERLRNDGIRSRDSTFSCSRDSLYRTSSSVSPYKGISTELDYSSVSPEYSGQSSAELSPRVLQSQDINVDSCCVSSWEDRGEWSRFWRHYNHPPVASYYDQCPTPYRNDTVNLNDLDFSTEVPQKHSPENVHNLNNIIRNEGLHLTPRETQNIIKCAHILGNVLTKAIERRSKEKDEDVTKVEEVEPEKPDIPTDPELEQKKKTLSLNLTETAIPLEVKVEKTSETVTTQTDISLPNTKSAPRIFESILRQLSRTTLEEKKELKDGDKKEEDNKRNTIAEETKGDQEKIDDQNEVNSECEVKANGDDKRLETSEKNT